MEKPIIFSLLRLERFGLACDLSNSFLTFSSLCRFYCFKVKRNWNISRKKVVVSAGWREKKIAWNSSVKVITKFTLTRLHSYRFSSSVVTTKNKLVVFVLSSFLDVVVFFLVFVSFLAVLNDFRKWNFFHQIHSLGYSNSISFIRQCLNWSRNKTVVWSFFYSILYWYK